MYCTRNSSFFPRFAHSEFAQVARLLDEFSQFPNTTWGRSLASNNHSSAHTHFRSFQPRFDVKESKDAYELTGELPGVSDINVEFTDATTLTIKGRSAHSREEGALPAGHEVAAPEATQTQIESEKPSSSADSDIAASETSSAYHKASVEDENAVATPAESTAGDEAAPATEAQQQQQSETPATQSAREQSKYWLSERSVGEFARTFTFPARVNQDAVRASLKDGILSVVVPKAAPATRRINVE